MRVHKCEGPRVGYDNVCSPSSPYLHSSTESERGAAGRGLSIYFGRFSSVAFQDMAKKRQMSERDSIQRNMRK